MAQYHLKSLSQLFGILIEFFEDLDDVIDLELIYLSFYTHVDDNWGMNFFDLSFHNAFS